MCNVYVEKAVAAYSETFLSTDRRYNDSVLATGITQWRSTSRSCCSCRSKLSCSCLSLTL